MNRFVKLGVLLSAASLMYVSCRFVSYKGDLPGCGNNVLVASDSLITRSIDVDDFTSVNLNVPCDFNFSVGEKSISVYAADNVVEALEFRTDSTGCLNVSIPGSPTLRRVKKLVFTVSAPVLEGIRVNGASDVKLEGNLVAENFALEINGAGDVDADGLQAGDVKVEVNGAGDINIDDLDCRSLTVSVSGAGDCTFSGRAENADIKLRGAGDVDIENLEVDNLQSSVKGAGTVRRKK